MRRVRRFLIKWMLLTIIVVIGVVFFFAGPLIINYLFLTETIGWDFNLAFSAGEMLQYYGAISGGLVTCFAIITTIHINNKNRRQDIKRQQFERTYALYHKLPEILTKLELAAIHVQYSIHLHKEILIETLDTMKESESTLRENSFTKDAYYSKRIDALLKKIIAASVKCQENVEHYLQDRKDEEQPPDSDHKALEDAFLELRESIKDARSEIMAEINQFVSVYDRKM